MRCNIPNEVSLMDPPEEDAHSSIRKIYNELKDTALNKVYV